MSLKCAGIKTSLHPQYWALRCAWAFRSSFRPYQDTDTVNLQLNVSHSCVLMRNPDKINLKSSIHTDFSSQRIFSSTSNNSSERIRRSFKPFYSSRTNFSQSRHSIVKELRDDAARRSNFFYFSIKILERHCHFSTKNLSNQKDYHPFRRILHLDVNISPIEKWKIQKFSYKFDQFHLKK